jgi:hypothetical protein
LDSAGTGGGGISVIWPIQCSAAGDSDSGVPSAAKTITPGPSPGKASGAGGRAIFPGTSSARRNPSATGSDSDATARTSSSVNQGSPASRIRPAAAQ